MISSPTPIAHAPQRQRLLRRMAWLCAVLVLCITSLSAYIRLSKAGLGCTPWPQCYGAVQAPSAQAGASTGDGTALARLVHRTIASGTLLLVLVMLMTSLASRPTLWVEGRMVLALLALALFLAVLGRWTAQSRLPAVTLGNLLGGLTMFALSVRLALPVSRAAGPAPLAPWAWLASAMVLAQIALGGLVSAAPAGLSCPALGACDLGAGSWALLNPWLEPAPGALPTQAVGAWLHLLHRAGGWATLAVLLALAWRAWRLQRRTAAAALVLLPLAQAVLGLAAVAQQLPLPLVLAHNLGAALLLALLLGLTQPTRHTTVLSPAF